MLRTIFLVTLVAAGPVAADDIVRIEAEGDVMTVANRLETNIAEAGATIFAKVDHGAGAESVGMDLQPAQLIVFGNPKLGTPAMQQDPLAGLYLPLKMLVYSDGEQTFIAYEEVDEMFDDLQVDLDAEFVGKMKGALENFANNSATD